jgi:hypothetical protein
MNNKDRDMIRWFQQQVFALVAMHGMLVSGRPISEVAVEATEIANNMTNRLKPVPVDEN